MIRYLFMLIALTGILLNIGKNKACFLIWTLSNTYFAITGVLEADYPIFLLFMAYNLTCVYGYWKWRRDK